MNWAYRPGTGYTLTCEGCGATYTTPSIADAWHRVRAHERSCEAHP